MDLENLSVSDAALEIEKLFVPETVETPEPEADQPTETDAEVEQDATPSDDAADNEQEAESPEDQEETTEEPFEEIKHNGEIKKLPKSEVIALAQKGFDYDHKSQALAEERRAIEAKRQEVETLQSKTEQTFNTYQQQNELMQAFLASQMPSEQHLLAVLNEHGSDAYLKAKAHADALAKGIDALKLDVSKKSAEREELINVQIKELEAKERAALRDAAPELSTPEGSTKLTTYLQGMGFTKEAIEKTLDHRLFVMANKARQYDELMKKSSERKPVVPLPKVTKASGRPDPKADLGQSRVNTMNNLKKTGKVTDAAAAIAALYSK